MIRALAIDGPAGAGKSTIARAVSRELGWIYVDTGAMFRAVALYFLREGVDADNAGAIREKVSEVSVTLGHENGEQQVFLNGENVSGLIRTEEVGNMASACSVYPEVRRKLLELQRALAEQQPVVMDGRDIGTVVLPDAETKVYLTASVPVRAQRRFKELQEKGISCNMEEIEKDIRERDWRDMHRETAPLKQAEDAVLVDSSDMTAAEVTERILSLVRREEA
ncbi:MAG: (d)CMP kinase [Stomatobaculum sp.]|nr:(d)CMP kinase [Stomatobaculum sp.]